MKQEAHKEPKGKRSKCPHCGSDYGYYERIKYSGEGNFYYTVDGVPDNHGEFYDGANWRVLKTKYCAQCHRKIPL
jgi:hypothetical protein